MALTPVEMVAQHLLNNQYFVGNDLLKVINEAKELEAEHAEKLKDFDYWKEWKNKSK